MVWTYSGNPADSERDHVRFLIGDTLADDPQFQDEELDHLLSENADDPVKTAARAARILARKFARLADVSVDDIKVSYGKRAENYRAVAGELEDDAGLSTAATVPVPYAGGIDVTEKELHDADDTTDRATFARGMHDA